MTMIRKLILLVFTVVLSSATDLFSQQNIVEFEHINLEEGLSQGSVYCVLQDQKGFLWFGTQDGLNKYDGYEFTVYRHNKDDRNSLSDNCINTLHQDRNGNLWIGTLSGGLNRFDRRTNSFATYQVRKDDKKSISSNTILSIYQDHSGTMWIGTDNGLNKMVEGEFIKLASDTFDIAGSSITAIVEDSQQRIWFGTTTGLYRVAPDKKSIEYIPLRTGNDLNKGIRVSSIYEDNSGNLFVGTHGEGLFQCNLSKASLSPRFKQKIFPNTYRNEISSLLSDDNGNMWIGYQEEGLIRWNTSRDEFIHIRSNPLQTNSLSNDRVSSLFHDKFGNIWVGTLNGINKLNLSNQKFASYRNRPGLSGDIRNSVFAITKDALGNIWTGTRGGLFQLNTKGELVEYRPQPNTPGSAGTGKDAIRSVYLDHRGRIWAGTEKGTVELVDSERKTFQAIEIDPQKKENPIFVIREDADNILWLGTGEGLYSFDPATKKIVNHDWQQTIQTSTKRKEIRSIEIDDQGNLWIGTRGAGLFHFNKKTARFTLYQNDPADPNSISNNVVASIYIDKQSDVIWVGTASGFNKFDTHENKFHSYTEKDGLPNDVVYGILPDDNRFLWLSTNNGVAKFDPRLETFRNYDKSDGLQGSEFNAGAYYKSPDGQLFFGGINGYNSFYPRLVKDNTLLPEVVLTGFKVLNEDISLKLSLENTDTITLTHKDYVFSLEFSAIHLTAPGKNRYAYTLEGFDENWVYTQRRFATYTNLDPGEYTFRVKASNNDGIWNDKGLSVCIIIKPPFWQTWWFYSLVSLLFLSIVWMLYKFRIGQIRKEEKLKTEFNKKLADVEMTALRAQMNPHFLFNCLNSINRFIIKNDAETASGYLTKFSRLIRLILQNSKSATIALKSELEALKLYIEMEELRFDNRFDYEILVDDNIEAEYVEVPPLLLQPYVENAIWHGLMHKEDKGKLTIKITREGIRLSCMIEDNGVGRQKAQHLKSKSATRDKPMGMKITTERLQLYEKQTDVQVVDLTDANGNACGTRVILGMPYAVELHHAVLSS